MSILVPSLTNHHHRHYHHHHHHSSYFPNNTNHRINENISQTQQNRSTTNKSNEQDQDSDHVPFGVVSSMKQRFLNKINESFLLNNNSTTKRHSLSKTSSRIPSNENLLQTKTSLKRTTRLSRSQDNLTNNSNNNNNNGNRNHSINHSPVQTTGNEQYTSYIKPKQDVIIVDTTANHNHIENNADNVNPHASENALTHRQSYTELHVDEAPRPGTVTTVKNMFERQIRLSRYDADKLLNISTPNGSRMSSQHRETSSPTRSRSISPNDMALRQRRTTISGSILPLSSTMLTLPVSTSYPDVVTSHTPPTETNKNSNEQRHNENLSLNNPGVSREKKLSNANRNTVAHEHSQLNITVDETTSNVSNNYDRPNLLLPSKLLSENVDCQPLDFKSRLALFNRTNTQQANENLMNHKKLFSQTNSSSTNILTKPVIHHSSRPLNDDKQDMHPHILSNPLPITVSGLAVNTAKAVTFFGGNKLNGNTKSSLPDTISLPLTSQTTNKNEPSSVSTSTDLLRALDIVGGYVKLNKSSIFSGTKKNTRVQFIDNVDTFEYPSFEVAMAELGSTGSDDDNDMEIDGDFSSITSNSDNTNNYKMKNIHMNGKINDEQNDLIDNNNNHVDDVDDDELERLARFNAKFNTNNLAEKPLKPKGTLHTFRPTHLDQYELGTQHNSLTTSSQLSDISSITNSCSILARQKLFSSSDNSTKNLSNHSILKQQKATFDAANNIQWSSMSTTTDLLF